VDIWHDDCICYMACIIVYSNYGDIMKSYRFRIENLDGVRKTIVVRCSEPSNVIIALAKFGWLVQVHYEIS